MAKLKTITPELQVFNIRLALALKSEKVATLVHQLQFFLSLKSKSDKYKMIDGQKYTYMSYPEWEIVFPTWSSNTIIRTIKSAEDIGVVISVLKGRGRKSRSKWYSINQEKLASYLQDVETTQNGYSPINSRLPKMSSSDDERTTQNEHFAQTVTEVSNTEISFPHKKDDELPMGNSGENTARPISQDYLTNDMSMDELSDLQTKYSSINEETLKSYFAQQKGYYLGKYKTRAELMGKVEALIEKEFRAKNNYGILRVGVQE